MKRTISTVASLFLARLVAGLDLAQKGDGGQT
jgi:hypothetical protein